MRVEQYSASVRASSQFGLRADSEGAPETHAEAVRRGPPWPAAIETEFGNHRENGSWELIDHSAVPPKRFKALRRKIMNLSESHAAHVARSTAGGRLNAGG